MVTSRDVTIKLCFIQNITNNIHSTGHESVFNWTRFYIFIEWTKKNCVFRPAMHMRLHGRKWLKTLKMIKNILFSSCTWEAHVKLLTHNILTSSSCTASLCIPTSFWLACYTLLYIITIAGQNIQQILAYTTTWSGRFEGGAHGYNWVSDRRCQNTNK